ncbi:MAG TPA: helix-turn-helix domain-containing protein [Nocardioidaceae bacterium]|nr:helix-turn-helix domain-containing protein [Nocardioidaceae bacterium]
MVDDFAARVTGLGALAEPARRALYEFVVAQPDAVSRDEAAERCDLPRHSAKFHLDRLVEVGLLEVEFRRLSGRTGPGAGRPAKLYRRAARNVSVSLPERRYDLAGHVLADAVERSIRDGVALGEAVGQAASTRGHDLARSLRPGLDPCARESDRLARVLAAQGYEPRESGAELLLENCPFDALARDHTELVCSMNLSLVKGVVDEIGCTGLEAVLEPDPDRCCVRARCPDQDGPD